MSIVDVFDFDKVCRTCLSFGNLKSLYEQSSTEDCLANMLMICTSVKYNINDDLPIHMCTDCINELNQSYKFALKCQEIDEELRIYQQKLLSEKNTNRKLANTYYENSSTQITTNSLAPQILNPELVKSELDLESTTELDSPNEIRVENKNVKVENNVRNQCSVIQYNVDQQKSATLDLDQTHNSLDQNNHNLVQVAVNKLDIGIRNEIIRAVTPETEQFTVTIKIEDISDCETEILEEDLPDINDLSSILEAELPDDNDIPTILEAEQPHINDASTILEIKQLDNDTIILEETRSDISDKTTILEVEKDIGDESNIVEVKTPVTNDKLVVSEAAVIDDDKRLLELKLKEQASKYFCTLCNSTFQEQLSLTLHVEAHEPSKQFACRLCFSSFTKKWMLNEHIPVHVGEEPYSCYECHLKVKGIKKFREHKMYHMRQKRRLYRSLSDYRDMSLQTKYRMMREREPCVCLVCNQTFRTRTQLSYHICAPRRVQAYTRPEVSEFYCRYCNKQFLRKSDVIYHQKQMHAGEKRYHCSLCDASFDYIRHKKYHMVTLHGKTMDA